MQVLEPRYVLKQTFATAFSGAVGYGYARLAGIDPKLTPLIFALSELACRVFTYINKRYEYGFSDNLVYAVTLGVLVSSLASLKLNFLPTLFVSFAFGVSNGLMEVIVPAY